MKIDVSESRGVRALHFGTPWIQGAMRIARPYALELEYTRDLVMPLLLRGSDTWPRSVLQVGLGAASVTRFLWKHVPQARLVVAEISPEVVDAARYWFKLPDDPGRITIEIGDARDHVASTQQRFDWIVVDGFDAQGRSGELDSVPFYASARERLTRGGMISVNLLTRTRGVKASVDRLHEVFGERVWVLPPSNAGNTVVIAAVGPAFDASIADLRASAAAWRARTGLDLRATLSRLESQGPALIGDSPS